ncbi:conserved hypothetical protein [Paraburkholderia piptadeniae]|uniref:Uncharacterized protein n=1 Tax=Paraburkholderia piptadeniae TaxID=1701573 RepID=A0A1N7S9H7_9BURK|nr:hypothetical protein [Paraburkholderia piptadeniae]SIT44002.1 conserved hypothetical protein [Paraburkholderia piptadeniae]
MQLLNLDAEIKQVKEWLAINATMANDFFLMPAKTHLAGCEARRQKIAKALKDGRRAVDSMEHKSTYQMPII